MAGTVLLLAAAPAFAEGGSLIQLSVRDIAVQIVGFGVMFWILKRFLWRPFLAMLDIRRQEVKDTYDRLEQDRQEMARRQAELDERLHGMDAEARTRIAAAIKEAQAMKEEIIADAHAQTQKVREEGLADIQRDRERALASMREEMANLAVQAAGKILGETLDTTRHRALIADFVDRVGAS